MTSSQVASEKAAISTRAPFRMPARCRRASGPPPSQVVAAGDGRCDLVLTRHVDVPIAAIRPGARRLLDGGRGIGIVHVERGDTRTERGHLEQRRAPDPRRSPGDDDPFPAECHAPTLTGVQDATPDGRRRLTRAGLTA